MHFGRVASTQGIDVRLPRDTLRTTRFLALPREEQTKIYVGCPIWACREWVGSLYPKGTKSSQYLAAYAQQFNCVEVNSTFYSLQEEKTVARWRDEVPADFRFCPKVFRGITENPGSPEMTSLVEKFCQTVAVFGERLGLTFAQFSERFAPSSAPLLMRFLQKWPEEIPLAVELRHPGWFAANSLRDEIINLFYRKKVAAVITDTLGRREVLHLSLTQPKVLVRFQGNEKDPTDIERLNLWAARLKSWAAQHLAEIYFFAHQPTETFIPETAAMMQALMR